MPAWPDGTRIGIETRGPSALAFARPSQTAVVHGRGAAWPLEIPMGLAWACHGPFRDAPRPWGRVELPP